MSRSGYDKVFNPCAVGYQQLAHAFVYATENESGKTSCGRMSYDNLTAYSYSTPIAKILKSKKTKEKVMVMTDCRYSNTTAKQKNMLEHAFYGEIIYVDCIERYHDFDIDKTIENYNNRLDEIISSGLFTRQQYRLEFVELYNSLEQINTHIKATKRHHKHADTVERLQNNDIKAFKEKLKEKQAKEKAKLEKNLSKVFKELPTFSERCIYAFGDWLYNFSFSISEDEQRKLHSQLQQYLKIDSSMSVVWFDDDELKTSQHISLDKVECAAMIRLWKNNKLKHGMTIGGYTVLEVQKDYVKVGCHKVSTQNLEELYKELTNTAIVAA